MAATQVFIGTLVVEYCYKCGIPFGMTSDFRDRKLKDRTGFSCPNGHSQVYTGKTEEQRLREELAQKEKVIQYRDQRIDRLHTTLTEKNHSIRSLKGAKTRILNRVKNGVCPCCNRTFADLQSHFKSKHPELLAEKKP